MATEPKAEGGMEMNARMGFTAWVFGMLRLMFFIFTAILGVNLSPVGRDDSDPGEWGRRSGISVRTDHLTGCQYLESWGGGLTPRVDREGRHLGCR